MNKHKRLIGAYLIPLLIMTLSASVLRTVALFTDFNPVNGHFNNDTIILTANIIIVAAAIFAFTYTFLGEKQNLKATFATPSTYVPSGLVAVCLMFIAITLIGYGMNAPTTGEKFDNLQYPLATITALLAIPSAIHFFLNAYFTDVKNEVRALFSLSTLLFLSFYAAFLYFSKDLALNAPNKIVDQMAFLFSALFFLYEARISLGIEVWRGYIAFGMISASLCAYSAFPSLCYYLIKHKPVSHSPEENLLVAAIFIFVTLRICLTTRLRSLDDDGGISTLEKYAIERQIHVSEEEKVYKDAFAIQMTIDDLGAYESEATDAESSGEEQTEQAEADASAMADASTEAEEPEGENLSFDFDTDLSRGVLEESDTENKE